MTLIVVPEYLPDNHLERLRERGEVTYEPDLYADRPALFERSANAVAIVIRNRTRIDTEFLAAANRLAVVGRLGVGLDNIDMDACAAAGVVVIPAVGGNSVSVAEYVIGVMLVLNRPVFGMTEAMVAGTWPRQGHAFGRELLGQTLGLVGFGAIAQHVARRALAFEMTVLAHDPYLPDDDPAWRAVQPSTLADLLAAADVVSVHTPLNEQTRHLIGRAAFDAMKPNAILINTSRGGIVDEAALVAALRRGDIGGAALDVFTSEPLGLDAAARFAGIGNLVLTPHVAGNTAESVDRVAAMIVDAVLTELGG